jgi:hypothetical protein
MISSLRVSMVYLAQAWLRAKSGQSLREASEVNLVQIGGEL